MTKTIVRKNGFIIETESLTEKECMDIYIPTDEGWLEIIKDFQNEIFNALKIPKEYLNFPV